MSDRPKFKDMTSMILREGPGDGVVIPLVPTMINVIYKGERYFRMSGWVEHDDGTLSGNYLWEGWRPKPRGEEEPIKVTTP